MMGESIDTWLSRFNFKNDSSTDTDAFFGKYLKCVFEVWILDKKKYSSIIINEKCTWNNF